MLIEHETQKLKELDEEHSQELKEWREKLRPRKKVLHSCLFRCSAKYHFLLGKNTLLGLFYVLGCLCNEYVVLFMCPAGS